MVTHTSIIILIQINICMWIELCLTGWGNFRAKRWFVSPGCNRQIYQNRDAGIIQFNSNSDP